MNQKIIELLEKGFTKKEISKKLNIGYSTVRKYSIGYSTVKSKKEIKCRTCGDNNRENFYSMGGGQSYYCKSCWNEKTVKAGKDKIKQYMEDRGGAKCQRCGYDKCEAALEFHHRDPTEKDPNWSRGWGISKLKAELDKCDILCANCHREIHYIKP